MKKFLSLVLALAMTMSLVTISAGAKDFTDADDIQYVEAVDVMSAIGVVDGDTNGNFNPAGGLTRGAAAKIICNLILGPTTAAELNADTNPYVDVDKNSTFAGYIAYCQKANIISGYADGTFKPAAPLTGYAFMKMLLGALGYDGAVEGYTGANWSINVAKQAIGIGLNDGLLTDFNGSNYVTREEAMLYAFNALQATMVSYETTITVGDVTIAGSKAENVAQTGYKNTMGNAQTLQFAEKYFPKLSAEGDIDAFVRPATTWVYDKTEIGTYVDYTLLVAEYTTKMTGKDLYEDLSKTVVDSYDVYYFVDGVSAPALASEVSKNNKADFSESGKGTLTEVYVDKDGEYAIVVVVNTYLAQATADYNAKKDSASFKVFGVDKIGNEYIETAGKTETLTVSGEDFDVADVLKDEFYLVTVADGAIQTIAVPEVVSDTEITAFSKNDYVVAGEKYYYADCAEYDAEVLANYDASNMKDKTYNVYLDQYGYMIGLEIVTEDDNYVFVTAMDPNSSNLSNKNADAFVIFTDGTTATVQVNMNKSEFLTGTTLKPTMNTWCTYTVDKNGVYTLKEIAQSINTTNTKTNDIAQYADATQVGTNAKLSSVIDTKHVSLPGAASGSYSKVYGNNDSIYLSASVSLITTTGSAKHIVIDGIDNVTTGIKNASMTAYTVAGVQAMKTAWSGVTNVSAGTYTLYQENGYVIATVVVGDDAAASKNLVYVNSSDVNLESFANGEWTWTREVIFEGEAITLTEVSDSLSYLDNMAQYSWYQVSFNAKGEVINAQKINDTTVIAGYNTTMADTVIDVEADMDTVLYQKAFSDDPLPTLKGSTLYDATTASQGVFVSENVKIVLIQTNKNKETTTYETGADNLEGVLEQMNAKANGKYAYELNILLNDGAATVVVIWDKTGDGYKPAASTKNAEVALGATITINYYGADNKPTEAEAVTMIENKLATDGYTIVNGNIDASGKYTWTLKKGNYSVPNMTFDPATGIVELYKVTLSKNANLADWALSDTVLYLAKDGSANVTLTGTTGDWDVAGLNTIPNITLTKGTVSSDKHSVTYSVTLTAAADQDIELKGNW